MKKLIGLFMLVMFIISSVPVFVSGTEDSSGEDTTVAKPTLISAEPIVKDTSEDTPLLTCIRRNVEAGLTREEAKRKCAATVVATAVSTTNRFTECVEKYVQEGISKERARVKCGAQTVTQVRERAQTCVEKYKEEGLTLEEARRKCAGQGLEKAGEILKENLEECIDKVTERYPSMSEEDAKEKCKGLLRARVVNVANFARLHEQEIRKVELLERARAKKLENLDQDEIRERLKQYKVKTVKKEDLFRQREITKNKLEQARERYQNAKERYEELKENTRERKQNFVDARDRLKACKDDESEECEQKRAEATERAREYIISSAQSAIEHLKKIREQVEGSDDIGEEEAAKIIEDIDNAIEALEAAIEKVKAAETKEELKKAAKAIANIWVRVKNRAKLHAARIVHAKVGEIVVRSRQLEAKLNKVLENMEEQGIEIEDIEGKVDKFSDKVEEARVLHKHSTEMFIEAKESANPGLVKQAKELSIKAHIALKEAHRILVDIIKSIKAAGGSLDIEEEEEVEIIEEIEEEAEEEELADATTVEEYGEETRLKIKSDIGLSTEIKETLDELKASFAGIEGEVKLELKVEKEDGIISSEAEIKEGTLTDEQKSLWETLQSQAKALIASAEDDDVELKIKLEHELEIKEEEIEEPEEAKEEIADAEEEIEKAEAKIAEAKEDGKETSAAEARLEEAKELAEEAEDMASEARMKYLGKTVEEMEDDEEDEEEIECVVGADCEDDKVCLEGDCEDLADEEDKDECVEDSDCDSDEVCLEGDCKDLADEEED